MPVRRAAAALIASSITLGAMAQPVRPASVSGLPPIEAIQSPAGPESAQPQLSTSERGGLLSWVERQGPRATLKFSERTASGWSPATSVASGTNWFVNWADVPSVLRLRNGTLVAHWLQRSGPDTYAYDVRLAYSRNDGRTWSPSFSPHSDGTKTEHGFASLFQSPAGGLGITWLDGRETSPGTTHEAHAPDAGAMTLRFGSFSQSWKQTSDAAVDRRVCDCCPTTAAVTSEGPIVAYRNRSDDEVRDIFVSRLENGEWTQPHAVHADAWKIVACPVNGPMLSAQGRSVALAWFTGQGNQPRSLVAFSQDAGRTFGAPVRLDDAGTLGRVDVDLLPDGSAIASWIEFAGGQAHFRMRRVEPSGTKSAAVTVSPIASARSSGYPRVSHHKGEVLFAWTDTTDGTSQVRTAAARWPATLPR